MKLEDQPISDVRWVDPSTLTANSYNPNRVFSPEMQLLKTSILESGWTQPVVITPDNEIIDGFHRWTLASRDPDIRAFSEGLVPVVISRPPDKASQQMATVRHNRARGAHGIGAMGEIVRDLLEQGLGREEIMERLSMEGEEVDRLATFHTPKEKFGQDTFGRGWVPTGGPQE